MPTPIRMGRWREGEKGKGISNWFSIMKKMQKISIQFLDVEISKHLDPLFDANRVLLEEPASCHTWSARRGESSFRLRACMSSRRKSIHGQRQAEGKKEIKQF